jgi:arsenite methyltransferase
VVQGDAPDSILRSMEAWTGCIAGALHVDTYRALLKEAGFVDAGIEVTRSYSADDLSVETGGCCAAGDVPAGDLAGTDGLFVSAFIRATKPAI